jgi:hypothetical protein
MLAALHGTVHDPAMNHKDFAACEAKCVLDQKVCRHYQI